MFLSKLEVYDIDMLFMVWNSYFVIQQGEYGTYAANVFPGLICRTERGERAFALIAQVRGLTRSLLKRRVR